MHCLVQVEKLVSLQTKFISGLSLSEDEEQKRQSLEYLIALTQQKHNGLSPYSTDAIRGKLSKLLKR
jgi:hypothetical protein